MTTRPLVSPKWTAGEDHLLRTLVEQGKSIAAIAKQLKRSVSAVRNRAVKLGVSLKKISKRKVSAKLSSIAGSILDPC